MKVTVRRIQTGVAAASTLLAATGAAALGCADTQDGEQVELDEQAINPGSGVLELQLATPGTLNATLTSSTTDEFVRVGESLKFALPAWILWETLYPNDPVPEDEARLKQLKATLKLAFVDKTKTISTKTVSATSWQGTLYGMYAYTSQFVVPAKTDTIKMSLTIKDAANTSASVSLGQTQMAKIAVFGGDLPNKTLLLDNDNGVLRQRVVDQERLIKGSTVTLDYTDWRADQVVDKLNLDTQIGKATFNGRFGQYQAPIYGQLVYEVAYAVSFDGGQSFAPEKPLAPNTASRVVGAGRVAYEGKEAIPATAADVQLYAHVKAYLVADYSKYQNVSEKWFSDNQKILLEEAYDNPSGAYSNYVFQTQ